MVGYERGEAVDVAIAAGFMPSGHHRLRGVPGYCGTSTAVSLLRRAGWQEVEGVLYDGKPLTIFRSAA